MSELTVNEAAKRVYGLLWRDLSTSVHIRDARRQLYEVLTVDERRDGIAWAMEMYGPISTSQMIAADLRARTFLGFEVPPAKQGRQ